MHAPYRVVQNEPVCCEPRHATDEWRGRLSACVVAESRHLNITYDCYFQNNNVKMTTL